MRETSQLGVRVSRERYTMILTSSPRLKPGDSRQLRETRLTNLRMAAGFTSPELNAPCTHILLVGRHYRRAPAASSYNSANTKHQAGRVRGTPPAPVRPLSSHRSAFVTDTRDSPDCREISDGPRSRDAMTAPISLP